jgi:guanine deaminase
MRSHESFLNDAVEEAIRGMQSGDGGPFGALVVRDGVEVARGHNRVLCDNDPSAHAEVVAIRAACQKLATPSLAGAVLYTSCEPCPMCLFTSTWARLDAIYYCADRHGAARAGFDDARFYEAVSSAHAAELIPMHRMEIPHMNTPFDTWCTKGDRKLY